MCERMYVKGVYVVCVWGICGEQWEDFEKIMNRRREYDTRGKTCVCVCEKERGRQGERERVSINVQVRGMEWMKRKRKRK